jgi:DNA-binding response OmpR family regulator
MSRLRKKLKLSGEYGWQLTAVYQHGYRLEQK